MRKHNARLEYNKNDYQIILQSSENNDEYYGMDELERKKLKIIQSKYGCRHCFHTLPNKVSLNLHKFTWNNEKSCFEVSDHKEKVQLNTLEEAIVEYFPDELKH